MGRHATEISTYILTPSLKEREGAGSTLPSLQIDSPPRRRSAQSRAGAARCSTSANNYLGRAHDPAIEAARTKWLDEHSYGWPLLRFAIFGERRTFIGLERRLVADFLRMEEAILYGSCFDANAGLSRLSSVKMTRVISML